MMLNAIAEPKGFSLMALHTSSGEHKFLINAARMGELPLRIDWLVAG